MKPIIITGTDTGIGKTLCSALLMSALEGTYFKPIQSGCKEDNDTLSVKQLSGLKDEHFLKEKYLLTEPLSPHKAAEIDEVKIDESQLSLPQNIHYSPLVVEFAGGLMVPINRQTLYIDIIKGWGDVNVILCARTTLGTINHALLSIEALRARNINLAGVIFIGEEDKDNKRTILEFGKVKQLGYIPKLDKINKKALLDTFYDNFDVDFFKEGVKVSNYAI